MLSKTQQKLLKLIVKSKRISLTDILKIKGFSKSEVVENAYYLEKLKLITVDRFHITYAPTVEGKYFFETQIKNWFFQNILAILALIVSIIALFN